MFLLLDFLLHPIPTHLSLVHCFILKKIPMHIGLILLLAMIKQFLLHVIILLIIFPSFIGHTIMLSLLVYNGDLYIFLIDICAIGHYIHGRRSVYNSNHEREKLRKSASCYTFEKHLYTLLMIIMKIK